MKLSLKEYAMKKCIVSNCIIGLGMIFIVSVANAMPINVISEIHSVKGVSIEYDPIYNIGQYSASSCLSPVTGKVDLFGEATSSAGNFNVYANFAGYGWATATSWYIFTSGEENLLANYSGFVGYDYPDSGEVNLTLVDTTTNSILVDKFWSGPWHTTGSPLPINGNLSFSPGNHQYELMIFASVGSGIASNFDASLTVDFQAAPVPEPLTMLLFGTGIAAFVGVRLREKKKIHFQ